MSESAPPFAVRIEPAGWRFDAPPDVTLLDAAARAGLRLPSSCRNGSCRACMCRMTHGQVAYRIAWPGLLAEEKAAGFILPCVAYARSDLVIEAPHAAPGNAAGVHRV